MAKKKINYTNGNIPQNISEILNNSSEQELKVLTLLLMAANENGEFEDSDGFDKMLGISKSELDSSINFWRGAGVIGVVRSQKKKADFAEPKTVAKAMAAHRDGIVESNGADGYTSTDLVTLLESRNELASFIDESQRVFGKIFSSKDIEIVVGLVDQYGFEEEAILELLAYVRRLEKKGVKYAEKIAISLYDDGITTAAEVIERIALIERSKEDVYRIKQIFGFGARALTKTEQTLFDKWTMTYSYSVDVIKLAYDMMIDAIQKPVPKYADKIIEKWHCEGLKSLADIEAYEGRKKDNSQSSDKNEPQKSYEVDDFFAAAMNRSFKDLK
jgi:DnaD/phage-associated family protein